MAFFKFRKASGDDAAPAPAASESVQALRRRARHRLIGATVLVLLGVIGFPLVFDNQPRPIAVDIPIDIPDKNKAKPLGAVGASATPDASGAATPAHGGAVVDESNAALPKEEVLAAGPGKASGQDATKEPAKVMPKDAAKDASRQAATKDANPKEMPKDRKEAAGGKEAVKDAKAAAASAPVQTAEAAKAQALLEGREPLAAASAAAATTAASAPKGDAVAAAQGRFVVQVGSYVDLSKAREARMKMERAGFKTYTQEVSLKDGKRLRVRVGPFETRAQAEKAAAKAKSLELSGAILEL
ncbi:MAG: SPOR domain-containing protein [Rhodoferax sp.]